jgi:hypothetical protein
MEHAGPLQSPLPLEDKKAVKKRLIAVLAYGLFSVLVYQLLQHWMLTGDWDRPRLYAVTTAFAMFAVITGPAIWRKLRRKGRSK